MVVVVAACTADSEGTRDLHLAKKAPVATTFSFPVGVEGTAAGYYDAQPFGENHHLGSDWNGVGGGQTDLGDPVLAIGAGVVVLAHDYGGGWGRVVRIAHNTGSPNAPRWVESLYAHLASMRVRRGDIVRRAQPVGTIGDAHGRYPAHLHFEVRERLGLPLGIGYGRQGEGYLDPTAFIQARRCTTACGSASD